MTFYRVEGNYTLMARNGKPALSRERDRARHEVEILEAAERLFATKGFGVATMHEVAAEAGFAIATLYNHFDSKDEVLDRLLERHLATISGEIAAAMARAGSARARIEAQVVARADYLARHRDFFLLYHREIPGSASERVAKAIDEQVALLAAAFRELGIANADAPTRALVFHGATRAYITERILKSEKPLRPVELKRIVAALLDGLARGG
jgi:AcrR family transcriptional regulator